MHPQVIGLRVALFDEVSGLDISVHGETVYYGSEDLKVRNSSLKLKET